MRLGFGGDSFILFNLFEMKQFSIYLLFTIIASAALLSCNKEALIENQLPSTLQPISEGMMHFASAEGYREALEASEHGDKKDIAAWESSHSFRSFGSYCDDLYATIDPKRFNSQEEVKEFVADNSQYLHLVDLGGGEYSLETVLSFSSLRYLVNKDRMFAVGQTAYKVFDNGIAHSPIEDIDKLLLLDGKDLPASPTVPGVTYLRSDILSEDGALNFRDTGNDCGRRSEARETNGRNRTYIRVSIEYVPVGSPSIGTQAVVGYMLRPYYRTLGIWYWATRTLSGQVKVAYAASFDVWTREILERSWPPERRSSISGVIVPENTLICIGGQSCPTSLTHFDALDCWADTPSTDPAIIQCNTEIF